jgi:hypothetical protein
VLDALLAFATFGAHGSAAAPAALGAHGLCVVLLPGGAFRLLPVPLRLA